MHKVFFDEENFKIIIEHGDRRRAYYIDLNRCRDAREVLDWIYQIKGKTWATDALIADVLNCFDDISYKLFNESVQGHFCNRDI